MSEIVDSAKAAREQLAAALATLQGPGAEELVDSVAGSVAKAMGALHRIESSKGESLAEAGPAARDAVRAALAALQEAPQDNPVVDEATGQVAASLGLVHDLAQHAEAATAPKEAPAAKQEQAPQTDQSDQSAGAFDTTQLPEQKPEAGPALDKTQLPGDSGAAAGGLDKTQLAPSKPPAPKKQEPAAPQAPDPHRSSTAAAQEPAVSRSDRTQASVAPDSGQDRRPRDSKRAPMPSQAPEPGAMHVEANLGAHSATNYYKGLSGNDVVDDGGIFIATYNIPKIGDPVWIKVTMPGGYEFEAAGVVRWTRESGAGDAHPGFGAVFESLSKEARQLVYRYVRNREPLFHDEL